VLSPALNQLGLIPGAGGGVLPEKLDEGVQLAYKVLALFMTKICDFPYPIYDPDKNLISYL